MIEHSSRMKRLILLLIIFMLIGSIGRFSLYMYTTDDDTSYQTIGNTLITGVRSKPAFNRTNTENLKYAFHSLESSMTAPVSFSLNPELDSLIDDMKVRTPQFLPGYKNPCWIERLPQGDPYSENIYPRLWRKDKVTGGDPFPKLSFYFRETQASTRIRCLPYYYIPGVSKCGTTDLFEILRKHPGIVTPTLKEPVFWNRVRMDQPQWRIGKRFRSKMEKISEVPVPRKFRDYLDLFDLAATEIQKNPDKDLIVGDHSPSYLYDYDGWYKMAANKGRDEPRYVISDVINQLTPNARIILILRNPIDRLFSDFRYFWPSGGPRKTVQNFHSLAVRAVAEMEKCLAARSVRSCIYDEHMGRHTSPIRLKIGMYQPFIEDWYRVFPKENIFVTRLEDYAQNRTLVTSQMFQFLGLDTFPSTRDEGNVVNSSKKKISPMLDKTRDILERFYTKWNILLAQYLKDDRFLWKNAA